MPIFLDLDGVLADFAQGTIDLLGMPSREFEQQHGVAAFWRRLAEAEDFYGRLPLLPDAGLLFGAVQHLDPTILTGLPKGGWAEPQKRRWATTHFPGVRMIACWAADKHLHCRPGDILVDDQARAADRWQAAGGLFIHHQDAGTTIRQLVSMGLLDGAAA